MDDSNACPIWNPDQCEGTVNCPPRCPRYVAPDGTPYTVRPLYSCPPSVADVVDETFELPSDASLTLVATADGEVIGHATLSKAEEGEPSSESTDSMASARVELAGDQSAAATELCRQVIARAATLDVGTVTVEAPASALMRIADELGHEVVDYRLVVPLDDEAVETMQLPPADAGDVTAPRDLSALVDPDSVAVIGATDREGAIGRVVVENLRSDFDGDVIPVTPRRDEVLGTPAPDGLDDLDEPPDLALVVLPADAAIEAVETAGEVGVDAVAVLSAGFGETDDDGDRREERLREAVEEHDLALVGPNALGVLSTRSGLNASFSPTLPDAGGVSIVSHSGALITAVLDWADSTGVGVRDVVSLGNTAGIDEAELLRYWGKDPETDVIFAYLEDVADGERFVEAAREVSRRTPVVVLKSGRSEAGAAAAASHTGAIADDDAGFEAAFGTAGVVRARSLDEAFDITKAFARQPLPTGDRVAVVTNAGGPGVLATDAVADADTERATFSDATTDRLLESLPDAASAANPIDVLGDADVARFETALETALADEGVDAAIVVSTPHPLVPLPELVAAVGDASRRYGKPVVTCLSGGDLPADVKAALAEAGVPNYSDAERAAHVLDEMASYARRRRGGEGNPVRPSVEQGRVESMLGATASDHDVLGVDAMDLLDAYGVPTPAAELATTREEAVAAARRIDGDVALKVSSPDVQHKTDVGGVRVGVETGEVGAAFDEIVESVEGEVPDATVEGVLVQEMAPEGVECLVGITRHSRFGPVVTFGLGGVFVEHLEDVAHGLAPLSRKDARRLVRSIEGASVLEGARGDEPVDEDALVDALVHLSWLAADHAVEELEVNPLVATPDGVTALDLHVAVDADERESADVLASR